MGKKTVFCYGEYEEVPYSELEKDEHGKVKRPYIHVLGNGKSHWVSTGESTADRVIPRPMLGPKYKKPAASRSGKKAAKRKTKKGRK